MIGWCFDGEGRPGHYSASAIGSGFDGAHPCLGGGDSMRGRIWTRGEEMAVLALRLYNEASLAEIASYIGRTDRKSVV